jgi:hypothetical protein
MDYSLRRLRFFESSQDFRKGMTRMPKCIAAALCVSIGGCSDPYAWFFNHALRSKSQLASTHEGVTLSSEGSSLWIPCNHYKHRSQLVGYNIITRTFLAIIISSVALLCFENALRKYQPWYQPHIHKYPPKEWASANAEFESLYQGP